MVFSFHNVVLQITTVVQLKVLIVLKVELILILFNWLLSLENYVINIVLYFRIKLFCN